jgi:hypothetical protein
MALDSAEERGDDPRGSIGARQHELPYAAVVTNPPDARELWSLIRRHPREERLRLAKMVLRSAAEDGDDDKAYEVGAEELSSDDELLAWDAEGREEFSAAR